MFIGQVRGNVVASQKVPKMTGQKLLVVEPLTGDYANGQLEPTGRALVVVDTVGAGAGEFVLVTQGSSARLTENTHDLPIDAVIVGIIDTISLGGRVVYKDKEPNESAGHGDPAGLTTEDMADGRNQ